LAEADWLRTQMPNSSDNVQNNLRLGAGLVWHFKKPIQRRDGSYPGRAAHPPSHAPGQSHFKFPEVAGKLPGREQGPSGP
jgi:hypothetical protein